MHRKILNIPSKTFLAIAIFVSCFMNSTAMIINPYIIGDNMIIQSGKPFRIWGYAEPGDIVKISFKNKIAETESDAKSGFWIATLPPMEPDENGGDLMISDSNSNQVIRNVRVGDVWIFCINNGLISSFKIPEMEELEEKNKTAKESGEADAPAILPSDSLKEKYNIKNCAFFNANIKVSEKPEFTATAIWSPCEIEQMHKKIPEALYYFAKLHCENRKTPLGLVNISAPGSTIESWISQEEINKNKDFSVISSNWKTVIAQYPTEEKKWNEQVEKWKQLDQKYKDETEKLIKNKAFAQIKNLKKPEYPQKPDGPGSRKTPSGLYNGVICTIAPFSSKGIFIMQNENDAKFAKLHQSLLKAMLSCWREAWKNEELNFILFQTGSAPREKLLNADINARLPIIREAQQMLASELSIPLLPGFFPGHNNKRRFAEIAFRTANLFHENADAAKSIRVPKAEILKVEPDKIVLEIKNSPEGVFSLFSLKVDGDQSGFLNKNVVITQIKLKYGGTSPKLEESPESPLKVIEVEVKTVNELNEEYQMEEKIVSYVNIINKETCPGFAILDKNKLLKNTEAKIEENKIIISCQNIKDPLYLFFGWADNPNINLVGNEYLALPPFRAKIDENKN